MAIPLNRALVQELIELRFGSVNGLVVEWEERVALGVQKAGRPHDRATIYRWLQKGLPSHRNDVLGFAGVLGVDPIAILRIDEQLIEERFATERRRLQLGLDSPSPLLPFRPIYTPGPGWPNGEIAHSYYGRSWSVRDFEHEPSRIANVYAAVRLLSAAHDSPCVPRTYHFAYRRTDARDAMWRPYGSVIGYRHEVRLVSESGDYQRRADERSNEAVIVETYFGPGPAQFRVASFHAFDLTVETPSREKKAIHFKG